MIEIRFHGRGGQGAVTAAEILVLAAFFEGKEVQSFPQFGVERRGAPVAAFCRIDDKPVIIHSNIYNPDCIVVFDESLLKKPNMLKGLKKDGWLIINTRKNPGDFKNLGPFNVATVDAVSIAIRHKLGLETAPIVNTTILGAVAKATGIVEPESLEKAIKEKIEKKPEENFRACKDAYSETIISQEGGDKIV